MPKHHQSYSKKAEDACKYNWSFAPLQSKVRKDLMWSKRHKGDKNNLKEGNNKSMDKPQEKKTITWIYQAQRQITFHHQRDNLVPSFATTTNFHCFLFFAGHHRGNRAWGRHHALNLCQAEKGGISTLYPYSSGYKNYIGITHAMCKTLKCECVSAEPLGDKDVFPIDRTVYGEEIHIHHKDITYKDIGRKRQDGYGDSKHLIWFWFSKLWITDTPLESR